VPGNPADVANLLADPLYMDTQCNVGGCGTSWYDFVYGKQRYLDEKAAGRTTYSVETKFIWTGDNPKPPYVNSLPNGPTVDFLAQSLASRDDVEIMLSLKGDGGHYVTLTGIDFIGGSGSISYIDPVDGLQHSAPISQSTAGQLQGFYTSPVPNSAAIQFSLTFAESEGVPEPGAWAMMLIGFAGIAILRRHASRGDRAATV
jgi:hypothetical protein